MNLSGKEKAYLKKLIHSSKPVVMIGGNGVSEKIISTIKDELEIKELIKIKFVDFKEQKKEIFPQIAQQVDAHTVDLIGNMGILFRQNPDPQKQKIKLPN